MAGDSKSIEKLIFLYKNIMDYLKNINIKLILFYGSLLGYIRNNNFILDDDDIDVLIYQHDLIILQKYIKNNNNNTNIRIGIFDNKIVQLFWNDIGPFDIYVIEYYIDNNINKLLLRWEDNSLFDINHIEPVKKILLHDYEIFIPNKSEILLEIIYGKDWIIPINRSEYNSSLNTIDKIKEPFNQRFYEDINIDLYKNSLDFNKYLWLKILIILFIIYLTLFIFLLNNRKKK